MIALSSLMQRERTALKIMSELLAAGRDELTVSDVIPVGDLFDVVVLGDAKPLTEDMKRRFQHAETFYSRKLRPYLLAKHGLTEQKAAALPRNAPFRTEDRLAKTLLVAEIAPGAVSLKNLTAAKLAALNFGTVASFVPGGEAQQVLGWVRDWAKEFGEISIGGNPADPIISIQLSGVDYDSVLDSVRSEDTLPNRRRLLRSLLLEELGVTMSGGLLVTPFTGTCGAGPGGRPTSSSATSATRTASATSHSLPAAAAGKWSSTTRSTSRPSTGPTTTSCGCTTCFSRPRQRHRRLGPALPVRVPHGRRRKAGAPRLRADRGPVRCHSEHLPVADREPARLQLENQRKNLTDQLRTALRQAYGVQTPAEQNIGQQVSPGDTFPTLVRGFRARTPQATTLLGGLNDVLAQALDQQFPDHPAFQPGDT